MAGGIVGRNYGKVFDVFGELVLEGETAVGGVVGYFEKGTLNNCRFVGNLECYNKGGGLIGTLCSKTDLIDSFAKGKVVVSEGDNAGRLIGYMLEGAKVENCRSNVVLIQRGVKVEKDVGVIYHYPSFSEVFDYELERENLEHPWQIPDSQPLKLTSE